MTKSKMKITQAKSAVARIQVLPVFEQAEVLKVQCIHTGNGNKLLEHQQTNKKFNIKQISNGT